MRSPQSFRHGFLLNSSFLLCSTKSHYMNRMPLGEQHIHFFSCLTSKLEARMNDVIRANTHVLPMDDHCENHRNFTMDETTFHVFGEVKGPQKTRIGWSPRMAIRATQRSRRLPRTASGMHFRAKFFFEGGCEI